MKVNVFYKLTENPGIRQSVEAIPSDTKAELARLRAEVTQEKDEWKKQKTLRKIARIERLDRMKEWEDPEKEAIGKILKGKTSENYTNSDLLTLRERWLNITNLVLVNNIDPNVQVDKESIKIWDSFTVNFGDNKSLRDRTWAGDILPANVKKIKINGIECERRNAPRPGYYNETMKPSYQKIYDGYTIEILAVGKPNEEDNTANKKQWKKERIRETISSNWNQLTDLQEDVAIQEEVKQAIEEWKKYSTIAFDINSIWAWDKWLLDFIGKAEWTWDNYNAIYANWGQNIEKFTEMTLEQILAYQADYKKWRGSAAMGRYQFMDYTLRDMMKKYDISPTTVFSSEFQDKLAFLKLNERWLWQFKKGYISQEEFQRNLSMEWASIAKDTSGLSHYHKDSMNNHASQAWKQVAQVLTKLYSA